MKEKGNNLVAHNNSKDRSLSPRGQSNNDYIPNHKKKHTI